MTGEVLVFRVPGVSCEHCIKAITSEVSEVRGVESVAVDLDHKRVTVQGSRVDRDAVVAAITEAGYEIE